MNSHYESGLSLDPPPPALNVRHNKSQTNETVLLRTDARNCECPCNSDFLSFTVAVSSGYLL